MADQVYLEKENRFWIDLHKCGTAEAEEIVKCRIEECFTYGVACLEIIYGTPDRDSGSIEEAVRCLVTIDQHVRETEAIHAGMKIYLRENPSAKPRDEEMHFSAFTATYQSRFRQMEFQRDYYPLRRIWSTLEVAGDGNCTREYVRAVAVDSPASGPSPSPSGIPTQGGTRPPGASSARDAPPSCADGRKTLRTLKRPLSNSVRLPNRRVGRLLGSERR